MDEEQEKPTLSSSTAADTSNQDSVAEFSETSTIHNLNTPSEEEATMMTRNQARNQSTNSDVNDHTSDEEEEIEILESNQTKCFVWNGIMLKPEGKVVEVLCLRISIFDQRHFSQLVNGFLISYIDRHAINTEPRLFTGFIYVSQTYRV